MPATCVDTDMKAGTGILPIPWEMLDATVVERPNRFLVMASLDGTVVRCHIHDPGRLRELIYPGNRIRIREKHGPSTDYSVVCAMHEGEWVILDSRLHPYIARAFLPADAVAEVKVGRKRIDFRHGSEFIEVKGCTLVEDGVASFPDAPSKRAAEHVSLLTDLLSEGYSSTVLVLVMRESAECFQPNAATDPVFAEKLYSAAEKGVRVIPAKMHFDGGSMVFDGIIPLCR